MMTIEEAIQKRHTVREYLSTPLSSEHIAALQAKINELNKVHNLHMQLILNDKKAFENRKYSGVENLVAIFGEERFGLNERAGYAAAELVLFAQTLGLNTSVTCSNFKKTRNFVSTWDEALVLAIAIGYGATQGKVHELRPATKIAPDYGSAPEWFKKGIDTVLFAPSESNKFKAKFTLNKDGSVNAKPSFGFSSDVEIGIFKYYFELGAGKHNVNWS